MAKFWVGVQEEGIVVCEPEIKLAHFFILLSMGY